MTIYTVNVPDSQVYIDGKGFQNQLLESWIDFSDVDKTIWAVHWDSETKKGEVEFNDNGDIPNVPITAESKIKTHLGVSLSEMVKRRLACDKAEEDELKKRQQTYQNSLND